MSAAALFSHARLPAAADGALVKCATLRKWQQRLRETEIAIAGRSVRVSRQGSFFSAAARISAEPRMWELYLEGGAMRLQHESTVYLGTELVPNMGRGGNPLSELNNVIAAPAAGQVLGVGMALSPLFASQLDGGEMLNGLFEIEEPPYVEYRNRTSIGPADFQEGLNPPAAGNVSYVGEYFYPVARWTGDRWHYFHPPGVEVSIAFLAGDHLVVNMP